MGPTVALVARTSYPNPARRYVGRFPTVIAFIKKMTSPHDRIFSDGSPALYVLTDRRPAIREVCLLDEFIPIGAGHTDEERLAPLRGRVAGAAPQGRLFRPRVRLAKGAHPQCIVGPVPPRPALPEDSDELLPASMSASNGRHPRSLAESASSAPGYPSATSGSPPKVLEGGPGFPSEALEVFPIAPAETVNI